MNKIKKIRTTKRIYFLMSLLIIATLLLIVYLFLNYSSKSNLRLKDPSSINQNLISKKIIAAKAKAASSAGQASKSTNMSIPANYGNSVSVPILYYHYIGNNPIPEDKVRYALSVTPDRFEEHMSTLVKHGFNAISLDTLYAALKGGLLPPKPIVLTFDDGYEDFYFNAYPILSKYHLRATSFIPTGLIGTGYYLNWNQIKQMDASNLISFEAHTVNHSSLISLSLDQAKYQVFESKKVLQAELGKPVNFFAYPYGTSNSAIWQIVKEAGFLGAFGTWGGITESEGNVFDMPRIRVGSTWSGEDLINRI